MELLNMPCTNWPMSLLLLLLASTSLASSKFLTSKTDRSALIAFKHQITGDPSGALSSWNDTTHFCNWHGVLCGHKHSDRVSALELISQGLTGSISSSIANLTFLRTLHLMNNSFYGEIPPDIGQLRRLRYLNLSVNSLDGAIPPSLANCSALRSLVLISNQLTGTIPSGLGSLPNLQHLVLARNSITGLIPPSIANISTLTKLSLVENYLEGTIPEDLGRHTTILNFLQLSGNYLSGTIPSPLFNQSSLYYFGAAMNQLHGTLPPDIGITLPSLQTLLLSINQFEGAIPSSLSNASSLMVIDARANNFSGWMPPDLGRLQDLIHVNFGANTLEASDAGGWEFLTSLTNCSNLQLLALDHNMLGGTLPQSLGNLSTQLQSLILTENSISGSIPNGIENFVNLEILELGSNQLTGFVPEGIGKLERLQLLFLDDNGLTGSIPSSMGNLTQLSSLYLVTNSFEGLIPSSLGKLLQLTDLTVANNRLNGSIPKEVVNISSLSSLLDLSYNSLVGTLPLEVGSLKNLKSFYLIDNMLSGEIPHTLGNCEVLEALYMDENFFQGSIPMDLSNMKGLRKLNLSHNNLSGTIPESLQTLSFEYIDLSFNHLQGEVPKGGAFGNVTAVLLFGNDGLCGGISGLQLPACPKQSSEHRKPARLRTIMIVIAIAAAALILILSSFAFLYWKRKLNRRPSTIPSFQGSHRKISYNELVKATDGFSSASLIGVGSCGSVYKGTLDRSSNTIVAIKVFNLQRQGASKTFTEECEALRRIRHRNLIKIITACSSIDSKNNDFKALVFEFMPNGSLETWLHPKEDEQYHQMNSLSLIHRLNIAVDVADAFEYLHHNCQPPVVHCDLKPSNVLLDNDMVARVGDFGLAKFLDERILQVSSRLIGVKGSIGYIAPEYGAGCQVSTSGDVYSYGILLLEMFTGKRPVDDMFKDGVNLREWVEMAFPDRLMEIADPLILLREEDEDSRSTNQMRRDVRSRIIQECLASVFRVGLLCSNQSPRERQSMRDVASEMHVIRDVYLGVGIHQEMQDGARI